jgi:hypothetical protein
MKTTPAIPHFKWIMVMAFIPQILADSLWAHLAGGALSMAAIAALTYWFPDKKKGDGVPPIPGSF